MKGIQLEDYGGDKELLNNHEVCVFFCLMF